jgi:endonuclease YncB( thermonuclease family)
MLRLRKDREKAQKVDRQEARRVVGLVDSTTLLLEGEERVRLIGVEPPLADDQEEIEQQAAGFLSRLTRDTLVHLVFEPANEPYGHRDRRQRLLAYVYLPDRTMVNLALIEAGFARADHVRTYGEASRFFSAEEAAQRAGRGMWAPYHPYR